MMKISPGDRFGRWTIVSEAAPYVYADGTKTKPRWLCRCECGNTREVISHRLLSGGTRSCGCIHRENVNSHWQRLKATNMFGRAKKE